MSARDRRGAAGERRATKSVEASLSRLEALNPEINAFTAVTSTRAQRQATAFDDAQDAELPLLGMTFGAKNLFDIEGEVTAAGSVINLDRPPARRDATAVRLLTKAGAVLVGMTNMDEYAYGFTTENHHYGAVRNPNDPARTSGGSSGGSAAAVAAGIVPVALGTDTNGSIRVPAACCGVFGLKPTFGRVSTEGAFPFIDSLDHVGPFAANTADLATVSAVLLRSEPSLIEAARMRFSRTGRIDGGLRIGLLSGYFDDFMDEHVRRVVRDFVSGFEHAIHVQLPCVEEIRAAVFILTAREGGDRHRPMLRARYDDFDPKVRDRLAAGLLVSDEGLAKARQVLDWARSKGAGLFAEADILVAPAIPCLPPLLGQDMISLAGQEMPMRSSLGLFTQVLTPMGMPIVSAPLAGASDLPVGVQILAPYGRDETLLGFVAHLEALGLVRQFGPRERQAVSLVMV